MYLNGLHYNNNVITFKILHPYKGYCTATMLNSVFKGGSMDKCLSQSGVKFIQVATQDVIISYINIKFREIPIFTFFICINAQKPYSCCVAEKYCEDTVPLCKC